MDVSIVIVNYKTTDLIINCINSIRKHTKEISYEIIIVDNNSEDDCYNTLKRLFPQDNIIFIQLDENKGFGMANNEGFKVAKGRNVFCLNPDTLLLNNAIKILSSYLDEHHNVGACGGNLYDEDLQPTHSFYRFLPSFFWELNVLSFERLERLLYGNNRKFNNTNKPLSVGYITGADLMIKKEVLEQTGGYSPDFFMYYEETDLCCRIRRKGYKIMSIPYAEIQHLEGKSFGSGNNNINEKRIEMSERSRLIYYRRNVGAIETFFADMTLRLALVINKNVFFLLKHDFWRFYDCRRKMITRQKHIMKQ